jgi:Tol biopolymer transport system component
MYWKIVLVLTILLELATTSTSAVSQARQLPQNGKIAYEMWTDRGAPKVYLMDADGSNKALLVRGEVSGWSPNGKQLLLDYGEHVLTVATGKITSLITQSVIPYDPPVWSPDGRLIAIVKSSYEIYTVKPDGTELNLIYKNPSGRQTKRRVVVSWSPDGKQLTFPLHDREIVAHIIGVNGKGLTVLRNSTNVYPRGWSPDGRYIFGIAESPDQFRLSKIVAIEVKTGKVRELSEPIMMAIDAHAPEYNLSLSPDGKTLAYTDDGGNIFTVGLDGGRTVKIFEETMVIYQLQWSPDGKQLVMECVRHGDDLRRDICIVNADGSNLRVLTESTEVIDYRYPSWQPLTGQ